MKYVLDANVLSALMRKEPRITARFKRAGPDEVSVPQPALAEVAYGIERLPRSKRRTTLRDDFDVLRSELPRAEWTDDVSECFASIKADLERRGIRIEDFDAAIAAHALARDAVLVTSNVEHMARVRGLVVEDWSAASKA